MADRPRRKQPNGITPRPVAERFWDKVDRSGGTGACWPWKTSARARYGYGVFVYEGRTRTASRVAYELTHGPIPDRRGELGYHGLTVMHSCDNPACCNPAHLSLGTHTENMRDARDKGRMGKTAYLGSTGPTPKGAVKCDG